MAKQTDHIQRKLKFSKQLYKERSKVRALKKLGWWIDLCWKLSHLDLVETIGRSFYSILTVSLAQIFFIIGFFSAFLCINYFELIRE